MDDSSHACGRITKQFEALEDSSANSLVMISQEQRSGSMVGDHGGADSKWLVIVAAPIRSGWW